MNPLLDFSGLPRFAEIKPEHVAPAIEKLLADFATLIEKLLADTTAPTWQNFVAPMEDANERVTRAWGPVGHLNAVMNSPELREVYNATLPKITAFYAELGQNLALFEKFKALRNSNEYEGLSDARKKIIENELRDFRLGGAELSDDKKARYLEIQERLSELSSRFSDNLLDATNDYTLLVSDKNELNGLPDDALQAAADAASEAEKPGWLFTLKAPSYMPVMQFCDNRELREKMYRAYSTRASDLLPDGSSRYEHPQGVGCGCKAAEAATTTLQDNSPLMSEIVQLRGEEARLLGFANFGELSLAAKMADTPKQVVEFMRELAQRARPYAEKDLLELREFARKELGLAELNSWDVSYASEKLREQRYAFSEQEVKQYFPEDAVLAGMFRVVETLYGLQIKAASAPVWHETVRFFDIRKKSTPSPFQGEGWDEGQNGEHANETTPTLARPLAGGGNQGGELVGQFYLDLYARNNKRGGAWMDDVITRRRLATGIQTPVAYLNCNFAAPVGNKPAVFPHDDVITLFHEFGHGLHHLLTEVEDMAVSGINGVEWDAVELPSQFMENFCWEWDVLQGMTRHTESNEKLPRALFDKMIAAKNFQSGLATLRQIEFSLFDMLMHSNFEAGGNRSILELLDEVRAEVAVLIPPAFNRFPNSFSHIFSGGYAAGYYSYKWAEVLSADAYSLFEENGVLNPDVGARFRAEILAMGGSRGALESFTAFRGRAPSIDALLRHNGLSERAV